MFDIKYPNVLSILNVSLHILKYFYKFKNKIKLLKFM